MIRNAASYCADAINAGALRAIEERAGQYVSDETWDRIKRSWRTHNCTAFAKFARAILDGKKRLHSWIGKTAGFVASLMGANGVVRLLADEIASHVPLPFVDDNATIAARGVQITGIVMCVVQGRDLTECACFRDVVIEEGKERVKELLAEALADWSGLRSLIRAAEPA